MYKSNNVATFTLVRNSLLIGGFHFRRLFVTNQTDFWGKQFLLHVNIHGLRWLSIVQPYLYSGPREMTENN